MEATNKTDLLIAMEGKEQPTLKAIAYVLEVPQQRIYSVAKQPVAGQVYDARVYNWGAISKFIAKRIGKEGDTFQSMDEVYEASIKADEEFASNDKRKGPRGATSSKVLIDLGDGKTMPQRRKELNVGDEIYLKRYDNVFNVVFLTETHVVLQAPNSPVLTCLSNWTLNQQQTTAPIGVTSFADTAEAIDAE